MFLKISRVWGCVLHVTQNTDQQRALVNNVINFSEGTLVCSPDGDSMFSRNVGIYVQFHTASQSRTTSSTLTTTVAVHVDGVRLFLWTAVINRTIVHPPDDRKWNVIGHISMVISSSLTLATIRKSTQRHNPQRINPNFHSRENLKSHHFHMT
jgi:hypothetical protein